MTAWLRATPTLARVAFASHVAYRAEMTIWVLTSILPLIMLALWDAVARDGPVAGFGQVELARYFTAALICRQLTGAWLVYELNWEIRSGRLSTRLLRPFDVFYPFAVWMLVAWPFRMIIMAPMIGALVAWRPELWVVPTAGSLALFGLSIVLAWLMNFLVQAVFGILSFWIDKSEGLFGVWFAVWTLLSGYVAPLAAFPERVQAVLRWLPFRGMLATPVELLGGFVTPQDALGDVAIQGIWVVILFTLVRVLWSRGLARYGAFGA